MALALHCTLALNFYFSQVGVALVVRGWLRLRTRRQRREYERVERVRRREARWRGPTSERPARPPLL